MRFKIKLLIFIQILVIISLLIWVFLLYHSPETEETFNLTYPLLSPRISANILQPNSYLIVNYDPLREELDSFIEENNLNISVYVKNLRTGVGMRINAEELYPPGSIGKIPVAILILERVQRGELQLDTNLSILEEDRDSHSGTFYLENITEAPVSYLIERMLQESDNTAYNVLKRNTDPKDYAILLELYYGYFDEPPSEDQENLVNPISLYALYSSLYLSTVLDSDYSQYLLEILSETNFPIHELAYIPEEVTIAHKYGGRYDEDNKYLHDCGIMYIENRKIFYCVMTRDLDSVDAEQVIGVVVNKIYVYSQERRDAWDLYLEEEA